jgi:3-oxoacyl-[acyl-carrier-protein] synthase II
MGVLAANGIGLPAFWDSLIAGRSGIGLITSFDASRHRIKIAGEVKNFDLHTYTNGQFKEKRLARQTQFAIAACKMAVEDAKIPWEKLKEFSPLHIIIGVSNSAMEIIEHNEDVLQLKGPSRVSPYGVASCQPHAATSAIFNLLGIQTTQYTFSSACPSGLDSVAYGTELIRSGRAEMVIAGGADAPVTPLAMASFGMAGMVSEFNGAPDQASRPFDLNRNGGVVGEGAGVFVLENLTHALTRNAPLLAEILGHGSISDAPGEAPASGLELSMKMALANGGLNPADVEYVNAHGPSDVIIDRVETEMIKRVLGAQAMKIPVSSIKGATGNPLAGAGPLQIAACVMGMRTGLAPPTANYDTPDPACDLDYVPRKAYAYTYSTALINLHGLGSGNSSLALGKMTSA